MRRGDRRLGDEPLVLTFAVGNSRLEVAVRPEHRAAASAPFAGAEPDASVVRAPVADELR